MARRRMKEYRVPIIIADYRTVTVRAHSPEHAKLRADAAEIHKVGQPERRSVLLVRDDAPIVEVPRGS